MKSRLEEIIVYFEGTCEICLGNMGIERYRMELEEMLENAVSFDDEELVLLYYAYALIQYKCDMLEEAYQNWMIAERYAQTTGLEEYIAKIYSYLAIYYYVKKDRKKEEFYFQHAIDIFERKQLYIELALHYINILWYKRYERDTTETIEYMDKALYYVQKSDSRKNARVYLHLGYIYKTIFNDFVKGIQYLVLANELCHANDFVEMESMSFHVLADGYLQLSHYEKTVSIYQGILNDERYKNITPNLKCAILNNLIICYFEKGDLKEAEKAIAILEELLPYVQTNIKEQFECVAKWLRAYLYILQGHKLDEIESLLTECEAIYSKYFSNFVMEEFDLKLCSAFGDLSMMKQDFQEALGFYQNMEKIAERYGQLAKKDAYRKMITVLAEMGDYAKTLEYCKQEEKLLNEIEKVNALVQYDKLYHTFFFCMQTQEMKELSDEQDGMKKKLDIDGLTKVYNRGYYVQYLQNWKEKKDGTSIVAVMSDIDYFKNYNDHYGHLQGDKCLKQVAGILSECAKTHQGTVIRYGGEEFIVFIENANADKGMEFARDVLKALEDIKLEHAHSLVKDYVTVSMGIAELAIRTAEDVDTLVTRADQALYHAKGNGKNQAVIWQ